MRFRDRPLLVDGIDADLYVPRPDLESLLLEKILAHRNILLVGPSGSGKSTALHKLAVDLRNAGQRAVLVNAGAGRSASDLLALVANELDLPDLQPDPNLATPVVSLVRSVRQLAQAPASVILLDDPHHPDSAYELFGRLREELWALPHQWVVAIRAGQSPSLRDGADSRLALCALDLRHVTGVQAGFVGHSFLAPSSCFSELLQVRGEDIQRIGHRPHGPWPVPTVPGTIGTGSGLRMEQHVIGSSRKNRRTQRQASARRAACRRARPRDRRRGRRPGDPRPRRGALICWVGDPGMLVLRTPLR